MSAPLRRGRHRSAPPGFGITCAECASPHADGSQSSFRVGMAAPCRRRAGSTFKQSGVCSTCGRPLCMGCWQSCRSSGSVLAHSYVGGCLREVFARSLAADEQPQDSTREASEPRGRDAPVAVRRAPHVNRRHELPCVTASQASSARTMSMLNAPALDHVRLAEALLGPL